MAPARISDPPKSGNDFPGYGEVVFPDQLPLARSAVDRDALSRQDPDLIARLLTSSVARVLLVDGARVALSAAAEQPKLLLVPGARFSAAVGDLTSPADLAYLGSDSAHSYIVVDAQARSEELLSRLNERSEFAGSWASPRDVGAHLSDSETGLITTALALMQWHRRHPRCPHCGEPTIVIESGWVRQCPRDDSEHFPRTDPAVIMAIRDDDNRLLLGRGAAWPPNRFSTLAGFVEPGETPENAVRREVFEEAGIRVGTVAYQGSQPWPFPASLMLAYTGQALSTQITVDGVEMLDARWFSKEDLQIQVQEKQIVLPGKASVARVLIEDWLGQPIESALPFE